MLVEFRTKLALRRGAFIKKLRFHFILKDKAEELAKHYSTKNIILLSSDCVGGVIMDEYKMPVYTPMVNIAYDDDGFLKICKDPERYFNTPLEINEEECNQYGHVVAHLGDVTMQFHHDKDPKRALGRWKRGCNAFFRAIREPHEICIIYNDNHAKDEYVYSFEALPYRYKIMFVHKIYPNASHTLVLKRKKNSENVDVLTNFENRFSISRRFDRFDFFNWFKEIYTQP